MYTKIDESYGPWDKKWHHVRIPLKNFTEMGSWDNNQWYTPQGLFDWTAVDIFDIVADYGDLTGKTFWFDNIIISNIDSSIVRDNSALDIRSIKQSSQRGIFNIYPNPAIDLFSVHYVQPETGDVNIRITDILGRRVFSDNIKNQIAGEYYYNLNRKSPGLSCISEGVYIFTLSLPGIPDISREFMIQ